MSKIVIKYHILIFVFVACLSSCKSPITDYKQYMKYIANVENGVTKTRATSGLKMSMKYLPVDYLTYTELISSKKEATEKEKEALKKAYENSLTFMMTFAPDKGKAFDVTKVGVSNYEEFSDRIEAMNFNFSNYIKLETEGKSLPPELTQMESIYGLENKRNILLVFNKKEIIDNVRIVYKDEIFGTGTHKFLFLKEDLLAVPQFVF